MFNLFLRLQQVFSLILSSLKKRKILLNLIYIRRKQAYFQEALLILYYIASSFERTRVIELLNALFK